MKIETRKLGIVECLGFSLALTMLPAIGTAQARTPEEVVVSKLAQSLIKPVKLDPRYALIASGASPFAGKRPEARTRSMARHLSARIEEFESVRRCDPHDVTRGEFPWSRCKLLDAESFVAVSEPTIEGDTATVYVTIWTHSRSSPVQPISIAQYQACLVRVKGEWQVKKLEAVAAS